MARKSVETVQVNLRIKESLRRQLERKAAQHRISLNQEMKIRLEDSLKKEATRSLEGIAEDMDNVWQRFSERLLLLDLEKSLAEALEKSTDREVSALARAWLATRQLHQQRLDKKVES
jgi:Arc-like DNA binding dprotein